LPDASQLLLRENIADRTHTHTADLQLTYEKNLQRHYLNNSLSIFGQWEEGKGEILSENRKSVPLSLGTPKATAIQQALHYRSLGLLNRTRWVHRTSKGGGFELSPFLTPKFLIPLMLITVFIATFNAGSTNLTMIGISLERENFSYLKVLPFDMKAYLRLKFWYLFLIQSILPLLIFVVVNLLLGTHWLSLLVMVLVWISNCLAWSIWGFQRDNRLLVTNWSNVTELFNRSNNTLKTIIAFLILFVFIAAIGGSYALIFYLKEAIVYGITLGFFLIIMVLSGLLYFHYANKFKKALE